MRRFLVCVFLFVAFFGFAGAETEAAGPTTERDAAVAGHVPDYADVNLYQIEVGAFKNPADAEAVFEKLENAQLNPSLKILMGYTKVVIDGIRPEDFPVYRDKIISLGFSAILVRQVSAVPVGALRPLADLTVSDAVLPPNELHEIAGLTIRINETAGLENLAAGKEVLYWRSSTPSAFDVDSAGNVTGIALGNGYIQINEQEFISIAVVPHEEFYVVPPSQEVLLPPESTAADNTRSITEYRTEPTYRLAWRFNNKGEHKGASGENGGIDILGRGADYQWLWTTYKQGGWFYDLNGVKHEMVDGFQKGDNGVELTVIPGFVYENGVPYLQLTHRLRNTGSAPVSGQRFGASADVMIHNNDSAPLLHTPYGAYMADSPDNPSLALMFVGESGYGVTPVDTLWLGSYSAGYHLEHIYDAQRDDIHGVDSAIGFSYQNIDLAPGETKEFIVRFTLARVDE